MRRRPDHRTGPRRTVLLAAALVLAAGPAAAEGESVEQAMCRLVERAATARQLPAAFLTRLIWQESSFRPDVVSRAGAQGIAQFMPGTARERGLADPFDPEQAIPAAAGFVAELRGRFGNLGLAAAAYNSGPTRVASWLAGRGGLPDETRSYVIRITGRTVEDWLGEAKTAPAVAPPVAASPSADSPSAGPPAAPSPAPVANPAPTPSAMALPTATAAPSATAAPTATAVPPAPITAPPPAATIARGEQTCLQVTAELRRPGAAFSQFAERATAPWGVQLSGNFSKALALAAYGRSRTRYASILGDTQPMVIGTRFRTRGTRPFYRVRVPAATRGEANTLCGRIHGIGGACVVLKS